MPDLTALFAHQAQASAHVQFVFNLTAGRVAFVNDAYGRVLHGEPEQVNAELPALLARLHPDDQPQLAEYWAQWSRGGRPAEVEFRLRHPEDQDQWFRLTPYYEQDAEGAVWLLGSLRDISVTKRYQANADLFNSRKNATLEILSHDLSGAFIMVQQIAEFLREEVQAPANPQVTVMLRELEATSRDSVKMIRDFINIEFLTSANSDLKRDRVDVGAVLREPLDQLTTKSFAHHFAYSLPAAPLYANLDVNKFTQVLLNLVSNALKFTPDDGHISVVVEPGPGSVRILVQDDGVGIPLALQPVLFEPFTKARRSGLRGEPSTGLGLVLCKTIVEWHRGTLEMVSAEGQGTTFTIEIPQSDGLESPILKPQVELYG
ncbi:PAS domain-containing sensor histidine kinase [Hymenobacter arizonensis]|uniref:histidine kinase n=1 Tax=Hymenobacter arizonensis TaxID=1227077 RepID=A0A1I5UHL2_HYMAR|nr:ATP-binding protein [Hymenobacter arizonensis]SFP94771.1 two-component system, OmpR family, sensor histidine kinase VicK [Hymenobacter arizonensis]